MLVFGQLLLPHALTNEPSAHRTSTGVAIGSVILGALLTLHVAYWRRVIRHIRAEIRLHRELTALFAGQSGRPRGVQAGRLGVAALWPTQLMACGFTLTVISAILSKAATSALLSPEASIDSPVLVFLFIGTALLPFALAMAAIGYSRTRLARLRVAIETLGR